MTNKTWKKEDGSYVTRVSVVAQERYEGGPFDFGASYQDGSLNRVIDSLLKIKEMIPAEYRDVARCEISSESGYEDSHYAFIEVEYDRPATDVERAAVEDARRRRVAIGMRRKALAS